MGKKNFQSRRLMGIIMDVNNLSGEERERGRESGWERDRERKGKMLYEGKWNA
ncbi:hypothetical protein HanXRQr2_Chr07g0311001 [Helianthus annuus]|uniref:Uncharacterized protein n=1 Tax=Helianthus annuus TaxID=4232 RepID=A0A9K3IN92_HELAN|nr:hypothetical protein HanXRQr2_Chr07g0311001 [Helianthus annuus]KAJ0558406.1 hypothetical protein HanIR_Chr07g0336001 [Helianthus annuus]